MKFSLKIELFNTKEFIDLNHLQEVTSPVIFQRGDIPHPQGLVSNEIFGITTKSRKETFAYIDLHGYFLHPHIYKSIKRSFSYITQLIDGSYNFIIDKDGYLVKNEDGETGIKFLYDNWEKIKWKYSDKDGIRNERLDLITNTPKDVIFSRYEIVIPAFYRDINISSSGGETSDLNKMYSKLIRLGNTLKDSDMFGFQFDLVNASIQNTLVDIYDFFKHKIEKKQGLIRKYLMGRNIDYCTRTVITAPNFHANKPSDLITDFRHAGIPISQICSLCFPFVMQWLNKFFERELFDSKFSKILYNPATDAIEGTTELDSPESYFTEKYLKKMVDTYIKDPESRFNKIEVPVKGDQRLYLSFTGKRVDPTNTSEISTIAYRPMTWTDLLYMACDDVVQGKHCLVTRYPLLDEFGIFIGRIRVLSTTDTMPVSYNGKIYKYYPQIDFNIPGDRIATKFIDSVQFSNSYLPGLDGDYDGDQTTIKILFTQEANEECEKYMNSKSYFINASGQNIRFVENEAIQTFYTMTKEPSPKDRKVTVLEKKDFLQIKPEDITFEKLVDWFGNTVNINDGINNNVKKSKFKCTDKLTLTHSDYPLVKDKVETTLGRFIYNKIIVEGLGFEDILGYINFVIDDKGNGKIENAITTALIEDKITVDQMYKYTDTRDWLGLQFHSVITTSFTLGSLIVPNEVKKLKKELLKKYKKELANNDEKVSELIENELIKKTKEVLKDDVGMDLYVSGARGSIKNNYKNINLIRGAVKNNITGEFDIITNSLMDGLDKKDMAPHSNSIVTGAYAKAVKNNKITILVKNNLFNQCICCL